MLNDPDTYKLLPNVHPRGTETPLEAIISVLMIKSIRGDVRAADVLLKYSVEKDDPMEETGFFNQDTLVIKVIDTDGRPQYDDDIAINVDTGTIDEPAEAEEPTEVPATVS